MKEKRLKNNIPMIVVLSIGGTVIYMLPYFRAYYYTAIVDALGVTDVQMGMIASMFGVFAMLGYLPGGWLADKIETRWLLSGSFLVTGACGLWFATFPSFNTVLIIHAIWGVSTCVTFWAAFVKAIRMISAADEQGKAYGFVETGRAIAAVVIVSGVLAYFAWAGGDAPALSQVILIYSAFNLACGFLFLIFMKSGKGEKRSEEEKVTFAKIKQVLSMPYVWLICLMLFCQYSLVQASYYVSAFTTEMFGGSVILGSLMFLIATYVRPVASFASGIIGDRIGNGVVVSYAFVLMVIGALGLFAMTFGGSPIFLMALVSLCVYVSMYVFQSLNYSLMEEGNIPLAVTGTAVGVISVIGYFPEVLGPLVAGNLLQKYEGALGYRYFFGIVAVLEIVGLILSIVWLKKTKEKRAQMKADRAARILEKKAAKVA